MQNNKPKILIGTVLPYWPAFEGASKVCTAVAEWLNANGYAVKVFAFMAEERFGRTRKQNLAELQALGTAATESDKTVEARINGVDVVFVKQMDDIVEVYYDLLEAWQPDTSLVSLEDPSLNMLDISNDLCGSSIALVHTTYSLPFGPDNAFPGICEDESPLRACKHVICVSDFVKDYLLDHGRIEATRIYMPAYGSSTFPNYGDSNGKYVTLVNPCAQKGLVIFEHLARSFANVRFAAVPTWGADETVLERLQEHPMYPCLNRKSISIRSLQKLGFS